MYYTINIKKESDLFIAETYNFSSFTLTSSIFNGYVDLYCAINYNETYPNLYKITEEKDEISALNKAILQIKEQIDPLSFWACAFKNGRYSKRLTLEIDCDKAVLLLPEPLK